jgi:hypothetical protein
MNPSMNPQQSQNGPGLLDQLKAFLMGNQVLQHLANPAGNSGGGGGGFNPMSPGPTPALPISLGPTNYLQDAVNKQMAAVPTPASVKRAQAAQAILAAPNTKAKKGSK